MNIIVLAESFIHETPLRAKNTLWSQRSLQPSPLTYCAKVVGNAQAKFVESRTTLITVLESVILLVVVREATFTGCRQRVLCFFGFSHHFFLDIF